MSKHGLRIYFERARVYVQWRPLFREANKCHGFVIKRDKEPILFSERYGKYKHIYHFWGLIIRGYYP